MLQIVGAARFITGHAVDEKASVADELVDHLGASPDRVMPVSADPVLYGVWRSVT
jgi:hypothetical protein